MINEYLTLYNQIMIQFMERPMSGDFAWIDAYRSREDELKALRKFLVRLEIKGDPRADGIFSKKFAKDVSWEEDVRMIMREE